MVKEIQYDVFLSHNSQDKPAVERLARRLADEAGLRPFLDRWHLVPGEPWQEALEEALDQSRTCAVFIGPGGISPWEHEEMRAAIEQRVADRAFRVIPVLLPGAERGKRGRLPAFLTRTTWVEFRESLDDADALHRLVAGIRGIAPGRGPGEVVYEGVCPYRGLQVFEEEHAPLFFGRQASTEWLVNDLRGSRFLAVVGPSGCGKSSLVRAGLVPALRRGDLPGSETWLLSVFRPSHQPLESLAVALIQLTGPADDPAAPLQLIDALAADQRQLHLATRLALAETPPERTIALVVDQFEEIFTLCRDEGQRRPFIDNLLYASAIEGGRTVVVLTMRADFYGKCAAYPDLAARITDHQMLVSPMVEEELRQAIERPAQLVGLEFEGGLVETLLRDVLAEPGALPLLQHTLLELWERREGHRLTFVAYREIGGIQGAIAHRAESIYAGFDAAQQSITRRIMLRLVAPGEGTEDTRRRARKNELLPTDGRVEATEAVIQTLADARLVTTARDVTTGEEQMDVSHEALIRGWPRLRLWIDEDRAGLRTHRRLTETANEWEKQNCDPSYLYHGRRLTEAVEWAETHDDDASQLERRFLKASVKLRRQQRLQRVAVIGLTPLLVIVVAIFVAIRAQWDILKPIDSGWLSSDEWLITTNAIGYYATSVAVDPARPELIYAADRSKGGIYQSADGGQTWQNIAGQTLAEKVIRTIAIGSDGIVYITTSGGIFYSQDGGANWSLIPDPPVALPSPIIWAIAVDPGNPQHIYVSIWHDGIWTTQDSGASWTRLIGSRLLEESHIIRSLAIASGTLYAAADTGLFQSEDEGKTWDEVPASELGSVIILSLAVDSTSGHLLSGTRGQGVWERSERGWQLLSDPRLRFAFSLSQVGGFTYVGSSDNGLYHRRVWHWWQPGWWRALFQGATADQEHQTLLVQEASVTAPPGMVWVPPGEFEMGKGEEARFLYLDGFFIDQFEVSWEEYCAQMPGQKCDQLPPEEIKLPVINVSREQAEAYCRAVSKRLPTEAEWEKAAHGADGRLFPWGDEEPTPTNNLTNLGTLKKASQPGSYPLGQSPYGARDMIGNVLEIAIYGRQSYVLLGGAWSTPIEILSSIRLENAPIPAKDTGFRCVQSQEVSMKKSP